MSQFLDMFREQMDIERKYREQIIKLAHAQEVMELLCERFENFHWFRTNTLTNDVLIGSGKSSTDKYFFFNITFNPNIGYEIDIDICRKNRKQYAYSNYTGIPKNDAAKIYEMVIKELV